MSRMQWNPSTGRNGDYGRESRPELALASGLFRLHDLQRTTRGSTLFQHRIGRLL